MSYRIDVFVADDPFPRSAYERFVANSLGILGRWHYFEHRPLSPDAPDGMLHWYAVEDPATDDEAADDAGFDAGIGITLYRHAQEYAEPALRRFRYRIDLQDGGGFGPPASALQFLIAASAFDFFEDVAAHNLNGDDPENAVLYTRKNEFLRHAARAHLSRYGRDELVRRALLDSGGRFVGEDGFRSA